MLAKLMLNVEPVAEPVILTLNKQLSPLVIVLDVSVMLYPVLFAAKLKTTETERPATRPIEALFATVA
jgi:hypothetical protein